MLTISVSANGEPPFARIEVRRTTGNEDPWAVHEYEWRIVSQSKSGDTAQTIGTVEHLYGDGALSLLRKVCDVANL